MSSADDEPPLTEPEVVPCLFLTGGDIEVGPNIVRVVGWVALPDMGGEMTQRRIVVRFAMPAKAARKMMSRLMGRGRQQDEM